MAKARSSKSASPAAPKSSIAVATAPAAPATTGCCGTATMEPPVISVGAKHTSPIGKIGKCCQPSYEQIAQRAHQIWIEKGRPVGLDIENWKQAEAELTSAA